MCSDNFSPVSSETSTPQWKESHVFICQNNITSEPKFNKSWNARQTEFFQKDL